MADGGASLYIALATTAVSAGAQVYSSNKQAKDQEAAAEFNAEQARKAAKVKAGDDRENALRTQEEHRKYLARRRALLLDKGNGAIEGGDADFLDEEVGNLELRILDAASASERAQSAYANQAFRSDWQAETAASTGRVRTGAAVLSGFNSIARTSHQQGLFSDDYAKKSSQQSAIN